MENQIEYEIYSLPAAIMLQHNISDEIVADLNTYLDGLRANELRESASDSLVGQIHQGEQLKMNYNDQELQKFKNIVEHLGLAYLKHFVEQTKSPLKPKKISIDKLWSVHSFEGDYNPIHDHSVPSLTGLAATTWTKVPEQITKQKSPNDGEYNLFGASGNSDGFLAFNYGKTSSLDNPMLKPPTTCTIQPEVGKLFIFPIWLQHMVYPFKGEGERRTIAANLCGWHKNNAEKELVINKMYKE